MATKALTFESHTPIRLHRLDIATPGAEPLNITSFSHLKSAAAMCTPIATTILGHGPTGTCYHNGVPDAHAIDGRSVMRPVVYHEQILHFVRLTDNTACQAAYSEKSCLFGTYSTYDISDSPLHKVIAECHRSRTREVCL